MILTARDVTVAFADRTVLDPMSADLEEGALCALTGRSGSGKTTLLLVMAGLLKPTAGQIELSVPYRDVVYVPQAPSLVPELSALQNASLGLRVRGVEPARAEHRGREQLRALGLDDADDSLPGELSGGMQQRVALARALAVEPRLLLVDEPTGALDSATGARVIEALLRHASRTGATVVVATHDPDVAQHFPDRIALGAELVR